MKHLSFAFVAEERDGGSREGCGGAPARIAGQADATPAGGDSPEVFHGGCGVLPFLCEFEGLVNVDRTLPCGEGTWELQWSRDSCSRVRRGEEHHRHSDYGAPPAVLLVLSNDALATVGLAGARRRCRGN